MFSGDFERRQLANGRSYRYLRCICVCGNQTWVRTGHLRAGSITSCGCLRGQNLLAHGMGGTPQYETWSRLIQRCENPKNPVHRYYGARGIRVCTRWRQDFRAFLADMPPWPGKGCSIDRINNDGDYEPGNCKWSTKREQNRNSRRCKLSFATAVAIILRTLNGEGAPTVALEYGVFEGRANSDRRADGVITSGSTRSSSKDGVSADRASSKAAGKSSVRSTSFP